MKIPRARFFIAMPSSTPKLRTLLLVALVIAFGPAGAAQDKAKDFKDIDLEKHGIPKVEAKKDPKTGFIVGGKNATAEILKLTEINGLSIARLESEMRPKKLSNAGFLGPDEKLVEVMAADNQYVVEELGLTHQELARHLHAMGVIAKMLMSKGANPPPVEFVYHGRRFKALRIDTRGIQPSPFEDDTKSGSNVEVENLDNGKKFRYGLLVPYMIERYGFYEGKGTPYRLDPRVALEVFDFLAVKTKKPGGP